MATTVLQVRVDEELKNEAAELFENLGIDIPTAIRIFFKRAVAEKGIPFELREPSAVYDANPGWKAFMELRRQVQRGKKRADYLSNCEYSVFAIEPVKKRLFYLKYIILNRSRSCSLLKFARNSSGAQSPKMLSAGSSSFSIESKNAEMSLRIFALQSIFVSSLRRSSKRKTSYLCLRRSDSLTTFPFWISFFRLSQACIFRGIR